MAISTTWTNFLNGATGAAIRSALNSFNTNILADVVATESRVGIAEPKIATNTSDITALDTRVTTAEADIVVLESPPESLQFTPVAVAPVHSEGQVYYDVNEGTFKAQGPISGVEVAVGHGMHVHVVNNSGVTIEKGMAVRHNGVALGVPQVVKALADTFDNARIFGVAAQDILTGTAGAVQTFGEITLVDTSGVPAGVPLYLSDTVAGTWTEVAPDIVSRVGGALTSDALAGRLFVDVINNKSLPTVLGGLQGQTPGNETYSLTTTVQDIDNYLTAESIVLGTDALTGILTLPNTGNYRMNFAASISFTSVTTTRSVTFEFYDITGALTEFSYVKNIPRDATEDSLSFSFPFPEVANQQYKMRVKASTTMDITFSDISFDIESLNIK